MRTISFICSSRWIASADTVLQRQVGFDDLGALCQLTIDDVGFDAVEGAARQGSRLERILGS
jgi:hypothetical protein